MRTVCMIPARGGSKRIPKKNIRPFLGKPIITYPIETAKASGIFDKIIVYTDDNEIAKISDCIIFNRESSDIETLTEAVIKFIEKYNNVYHKDIDYLCVLLPTAVFVNIDNLNTAMRIFELGDGIDGVLTFCQYPHPIQRAFIFNWDNELRMREPEYMFTRTQDIDNGYYDAGQMYFLNVKSFLEQKRIFMNNIYPIIIDAVDIDNEIDWKKAEAFYKVIHE